MKKVEYLSPSQIALYKKSKEEYYLKYISDHRPADPPQTAPMAVGSAFDAFVKNYLYEGLFGKNNNPKYDKIALFEAQVQPLAREEAYRAGEHVFEVYKKSGMLADLMIELQQAIGPPRFEFDVMGVVNGYREGITLSTNGVTFMGKPDVYFNAKSGAHIILDFKVNGYYSNYNTTPMTGYISLRDETGKNSGQHKKAFVQIIDGVKVNCANFFEALNDDWARQLSIYTWLLGVNIGEQFIAKIHQICCKPTIRIAEHSLRTSFEFQWKEFAYAQKLWEKVHPDTFEQFYYFDEISIEESQARCKALDGVSDAIKSDGTVAGDWFTKVCR